jgi:hypothetical protein
VPLDRLPDWGWYDVCAHLNVHGAALLAGSIRVRIGLKLLITGRAWLSWSREFDDPISLPDGRKLLTLKDAADYIMKLPKKESDLPEWQAAIEALMLCSRGGPTMMARIGVMRALNRHVERVFNPDRKDTHWGKRKLERDQ